jgi:alkylated DNA repair dioxygenase AlkB
VPEGFLYRAEFLTPEEERELLREIEQIPFSEVRMHGVVARRRTAHYGWLYGYESWRITPGPPIPNFLLPVRERSAAFAGVNEEELTEALITEYPAGAGIGWHRDAPMFGVVVALSLLGRCRLRFQRGKGEARETAEQVVQPRSIYALTGPARNQWQHSIPPQKEPRYSITFRTVRSAKTG